MTDTEETRAQNRQAAQKDNTRFKRVFDQLETDEYEPALLRMYISEFGPKQLDMIVEEFIRRGFQNNEGLEILFEFGASKKSALYEADVEHPGEEGIFGRKWGDYAYSEEYSEINSLALDALKKKRLSEFDLDIGQHSLIKLINNTSSRDLDKVIDGESLLTLAAKEGYFDAVELLIEKGANPHVKDASGKTVLDYVSDPSIKWYDTDIDSPDSTPFSQSHDNKVSPDRLEELGANLSRIMALEGLEEAAKKLVTKAIDIKEIPEVTTRERNTSKPKKNNSPKLKDTTRSSDGEVYKAFEGIIDDGERIDPQRARFMASSLREEERDKLIAKMISLKDAKYDQAVEIFFEYGADREKALKVAEQTFPPEEMHQGLGIMDFENSQDYTETVDLIDRAIAKAESSMPLYLDHTLSEEDFIKQINQTSSRDLDERINGETMLTFAASKGYLDAVDLLLERGANPHTIDIKGRSAEAHLEEFIEEIDPGLPDASGASLIAEERNERVQESLGRLREVSYFPETAPPSQEETLINATTLLSKDKISSPASLISDLQTLDSSQLTELAGYLIQNNLTNFDRLKIVLEQGADHKKVQNLIAQIHPEGTLWNSRERNSYNELFESLHDRQEFPEIFTFKDERELSEFVSKVSSRKLDTPDREGKTLLTFASEKGYFKAVKQLLTKGANPNLADASGQSAYDYLSGHEDEELGQNASRLGFMARKEAQESLDLIRSYGGISVSSQTPDSLGVSEMYDKGPQESMAFIGLRDKVDRSLELSHLPPPKHTKYRNVDAETDEDIHLEASDDLSTSRHTEYRSMGAKAAAAATDPHLGENDTLLSKERSAPLSMEIDTQEYEIEEKLILLEKVQDQEKNIIHHNHPESHTTLVEETGNEQTGYKFEPTEDMKSLGKDIVIEIPCLDKRGRMLSNIKEKLVLDPVTREIVDYVLPEGHQSRIDQKWFKTLKQKQSLSMATIKTVDEVEKPKEPIVKVYRIMLGSDGKNSLIPAVHNGNKFLPFGGDKVMVDIKAGTVDIEGKDGKATDCDHLVEIISPEDPMKNDILIFEKGKLVRSRISTTYFEGNLVSEPLTERDEALINAKPIQLKRVRFASDDITAPISRSTSSRNILKKTSHEI